MRLWETNKEDNRIIAMNFYYLIIIGVVIAGVQLIAQVIFYFVFLKRFSFAGTKSKIEAQIKSIESNGSNSSELRQSIDALKSSINNIRVF